MAKSENQKLKLLYLMQILLERTDEDHVITMKEILESLKKYDITAERKSIYSDIGYLRSFGLDVIGEQRGGAYCYYVASREFELPELKLLVDSIQSSKFITLKKSKELIKKIEGLASKHQARQLQRQVYVSERIKPVNESIYYTVDALHNAIAENKQIRFQYFQWNVKKEMQLKRDGAYYQVSPWALSWADDNYYLVAYDNKDEKIKHYRVDKMLHIAQSEEARAGQKIFEKFDVAVYTRKMFSMFGGKEEMVRLECKNELAGVFIDRFGKDIPMRKIDDEHFAVTVKVALSRKFLHWIMGLNAEAKIVGPEHVVEATKAEVQRLRNIYE